MRRILATRRGFTLMEIMVSLVIFGLVMAISYPMLARANRNHRLLSAATQIETALGRARSSAVTTQEPVRVSFSPAINQLQIDRDTTGDGNFDTFVRAVTIDDDIAMQSVQFNGGRTIVFDQRGAPDNPGTVLLGNGTTTVQRVLVSAGSGAVTVRAISIDRDAKEIIDY